MDGFKKPHRNTRIRPRSQEPADQTLINLYKESEFAQENAAELAEDGIEVEDVATPDSATTPEDITTPDDDIAAFINDSGDKNQLDLPERAAAKHARKRAARKERRRSSIKRTFLILFVIALLTAGVVTGTLWLFTPSINETVLGSGRGEDAVADNIFYSALTGLEISQNVAANAEVTCIMIENSTTARPQSGLRAAGVVYEAIAEGGISRFMAIYQDNKPEYIGPIRSARLTFVQLAKQYQCGYVHVGGATNAINELNSSGYRNIDAGYYEEKYVSRKISSGRRAPHNVYTRFSWLDQLNYAKGWNTSNYTPFARVQADTITEAENRDATTITIKLSGDNSYNPGFTYDANTNTYLRWHQHGGAHYDKAEDGTLTQISPTVVVAMKVHVINRAGDVNGYKDHVTYGEGDCFVFQNGTVTAGKWKRATASDPLKFYNSNDEEILLNRGQTWVTAYPDTIGTVNWN